jgi:hypothetical protein
MSEKKTSHEVKGIVHRAQRQGCVKAQNWGRVPKYFCSIEGNQGTIAFIILKWKKFGTTKTEQSGGR